MLYRKSSPQEYQDGDRLRCDATRIAGRLDDPEVLSRDAADEAERTVAAALRYVPESAYLPQHAYALWARRHEAARRRRTPSSPLVMPTAC